MVKSVTENSAAGYAHPDDPTLRIPQVAVVNSAGLPDPSEGVHAYGYDGSWNMITDTWTVNGAVYIKTYTYNASGFLIGKATWVKQ